MSSELLQIIAVISGFSGSVLITRRHIGSFYCWGAANVTLIAINYLAGMHVLIVLYVGYLILNVVGIVKWRKHSRVER